MENLTQKQKKLSQKLLLCCDMIKGSLSSVCATCNRANCICKTKSGKVVYRLTYKDENQITKTVYVPSGRIKEMEKRILSFEKARKIISEIIEINIQIFKKEGSRNS